MLKKRMVKRLAGRAVRVSTFGGVVGDVLTGEVQATFLQPSYRGTVFEARTVRFGWVPAIWLSL